MVLRTVELAIRLHTAVPVLTATDAYAHASAAVSASTQHLNPELLLAIAFVESRYDPTATSRVEHGVRLTGHYGSSIAPAGLDPGTSLFCGPLQAYTTTWQGCLALRDLHVGYAVGVSELEQWLRDIRVRGDIGRALAGHGCGNAGLVNGCNTYPARIRAVEAMLMPQRPATSRVVATS